MNMGYESDDDSEDEDSWGGSLKGGMIRSGTAVGDCNKIYNPQTGGFVDFFTPQGKNILKSYLQKSNNL